MKNSFSGYHPIVSFTWFGLVLFFSMVLMHPIMLGISLFCSAVFSAYLAGGKFGKALPYLIPLILFTALLNPAFNHEGATILLWLPSGNPLTLEAIIYGLAAAAMLSAVTGWFFCLNRIITSDKWVYLLGRVLPALSLILSMTLRFVPRFTARLRAVSNAKKCAGQGAAEKGLIEKTKHALSVLSITVTWALENSVDTADSMKSRGYGLPGRTAFSIYRFSKRDACALALILSLAACVTAGWLSGLAYWQYYPTFAGEYRSPLALAVFACWFSLCILPVFLSVREGRKWKSSKYPA